MPSWKIHSKIGYDILKKINVNEKYFMIGNLLPDQDSYNIKDLKVGISRKITHYISDENYKVGINLPDYEKFFDKYKIKLNNPVILGYLVHLLTDFFWNNYIYEKYFIKENGIYVGVKLNSKKIYKCNFREMNTFKQEDFEVFNNSIDLKKKNYKFCLNSKYFKELDEIKISKHNLFLVGEYLNIDHNSDICDKKFKFLSENECNKILGECENFILNYLKSKKI